MRLYALMNFQDVVLFLFPTLIFILLFGMALGFSCFHGDKSRQAATRIVHTYPDDIRERNAPFPLALLLIIVGTILWAFFYILVTGLTGVTI
ncbi:MAG: cbb3-type cytochrome c oxidase N-terminal domain-containing protein [Desulfobacterales bacterium]|nr:cbb3-type cytochrome c oxidase N-terminal domain-containing protein [Desulfobacterales bacterium]